MFRRNPFTRLQVIERSLLERKQAALGQRVEQTLSREVHLSPEPPNLTAEDIAELTGPGIDNTHTPQIHISVRRGSVVVTDQLDERCEETFHVGSAVAENLDYALRVVKSKLGMSTDIVPRAVLLNFNMQWPTKPGIYAVKDNGVERGFRIASVTQNDVNNPPMIRYGRYAFVCPPPLEPQ